MCEKYSEYAQICANNERKYAEICGKYVHIVWICGKSMRYASFAAICGKICDMCIWPKYADPKSVRRIVGIGSVGIGTCT